MESMTYDYNAKENYYSFLSGSPKAWELLFTVGSAIKRNDTVNVIEVDSEGDPTGNTMTGTVLYRDTSNFWAYKVAQVLVYVIPD